ncbi:M48 family metalloprotease [Cystobacter fuscus]|uniref:M48 family metalloprotease n=1 Tax=Cystobacter fuscus TaxID=43 RepID=UPI0012DDFE90|nr:M48 family metalloprotease [Cystobacter fuscus]
MNELDEIEAQKLFYRFLFSPDEVNRIFDVKNVDDYLLKLRANHVMDNTRLYRVMLHRARESKGRWSFSDQFSRREFDAFVSELSEDREIECKSIAAGFVFSNNPNGECVRTPFGDLIVVSESLRYFLFYMNLSFMDLGYDVPQDVRFSALLIAMRTMLKSETLDFDLDPRGRIPAVLEERLNVITMAQLEFVIGHEYAHHMLKHLDSAGTTVQSLFMAFRNESIADTPLVVYNYNQKQEFAADEGSLFLPIRQRERREFIFRMAALFFVYMDVFDSVQDEILPRKPYAWRTHPDAVDRIWNLFGCLPRKSRKNSLRRKINRALRMAKDKKEHLAEGVRISVETFETYGSFYLGQWRGPILVDRRDY